MKEPIRFWNVAAHTFRLCSGVFFIDGVKRDKWLWAGDAYQRIFVNQYLLADTLLKRMRSYWGGMLKRGAVTFWEEFDPTVPEAEQHDMYGDRFGKSLCHAWAASPIYLIGRYLLGLEHLPGGCYTVNPRWDLLPLEFEAVLPVRGGSSRVRISRNKESRSVEELLPEEADLDVS